MSQKNIDREIVEELRKARIEFLKSRPKMSENLEKELLDKFKEIFHSEKPSSKSLMSYGFSCNDGWFELIFDLCQDLMALAKKSGTTFEVVQVKQKFGHNSIGRL